MKELERKILDTAFLILESETNFITEKGISFHRPCIKIRNIYPYSSEFVIEFFYDGELVDILEFEIYRHDEPVTNLQELKKWLSEQIPTISAN
jgi:hypothetical protein